MCFKLYCTSICLLSVTCLGPVISQPTLAPRHSRTCEQSSAENKLLHERILSMETLIKSTKELFAERIAEVTNKLEDHEMRLDKLKTVYDCKDLQMHSPSSIYTIQLSDGSTKQVYCDMETDGGGWLVFQRRQDGSENFYRGWTDYKKGFGELEGEFWLGNDFLAAFTSKKSYELRVDIEDFEGNQAYAVYSNFSMDALNDFKLSLGTYSGTAGDSLTYHNNMKFSTFDHDNDAAGGNCAKLRKGAWWYKSCNYSNLNGAYLPGQNEMYVVNWFHFKNHDYCLMFSEMKLRPAQ